MEATRQGVATKGDRYVPQPTHVPRRRALLVGATACGSGEASGDLSSVTETSAVSTGEGVETETSSSSTTPSSTSAGTSSETDDGSSDGAAGPATQVVNVWVDDFWNVEELDEDGNAVPTAVASRQRIPATGRRGERLSVGPSTVPRAAGRP